MGEKFDACTRRRDVVRRQNVFSRRAETERANGRKMRETRTAGSCALGDGSVRILSPQMSVTTFWGAVTPAGGEVSGKDW
jgi:hypothetical protein